MRVIGTAGHVDHGKSTLIRALTGIDPDRLREEKERGMTIDLGFAWLRLPSGQEASVIDVPGHERFIKNMLAGVGGIDIALLVIAADEGVMPQTREHLAILDLLGIGRGVVAITKCDLVEDEWLELVCVEVEETVAPTTLAGARLVAVSSTTGRGLDDLRQELDSLLATERQRRQTGLPRLPVDRVFTMSGFGTIVTGTLIDGELQVGAEVEILPSGRRARIRGLQSHRKQVDRAPAGSRVAINLSSIGTDEIERGDVVTAPGWLKATRVVDVQLRAVADAERPLPHNARVTFHAGAAEAMGRVSLLDRPELGPGETSWAQIRLDRPLAVARSDPFILRLPSPSATVGGGTIVDDHPKRHRRMQERVLRQLAVLQRGTPEEIALQTLQEREPADVAELARRSSKSVAEMQGLLAPLVQEGAVVVLDRQASDEAQKELTGSSLVISSGGWSHLAERVVTELRGYHVAHRLRSGMPIEELRKRLGLDARAFSHIERRLLENGTLAEDGPRARLPEFSVTLSVDEERAAQALVSTLEGFGVAPPNRAEIRAAHGVSDEVIQALIDRGTLVEVAQDLVYARSTYDEVVARILAALASSGRVTVAQVRDVLGTSRRYALALLEHLDDQKITRRVGDERILSARGAPAATTIGA
ncbi:MAG TPA: selenocysteine-specific translation elongation factor [Chloroflexota bacterium]|nr:selenocysteine-specific translation elongation factor [Chloroflexota bacterium]